MGTFDLEIDIHINFKGEEDTVNFDSDEADILCVHVAGCGSAAVSTDWSLLRDH
jgi:hypothetical protein